MPINITMPALSPTMEVGTLAKWVVKVGDAVKSGDIIAEIETDKATMEVEAVDEGVVAALLVAEGTDNIPVGQTIAQLTGEDEDAAAPPSPRRGEGDSAKAERGEGAAPLPSKTGEGDRPPAEAGGGGGTTPAAPPAPTDRNPASPLARRLAAAMGVDLATVTGTGPGGRIVKADIEAAAASGPATAAKPAAAAASPAAAPAPAAGPAPTAAAAPAPKPAAPAAVNPGDIPHEIVKLSGMRKTIARRLTESKQQVPHIYLTVDINLDKLLKLRTQLNGELESRNIKLSVNDMLIKALAVALAEVPACNVAFAGDNLIKYSRSDISVAVSLPAGLITPIIAGAESKSLSAISSEMKVLAAKARDGKLQPHEYQGGTASLSNMGMYGIKQFEAVINPPQAMIMAIGAGEQRPYVVDGALAIASIMSATGSFDHRAIDGADGAQLMQAFKRLCENPLGMLA